MQIKRTSTAIWKGTGKEGAGTLSSQSGVLRETQYGFNSRFADGIGTNPEELIAAAHAGCFSMKLSFCLVAAGFTAEQINTSCEIILEEGNITNSNLIVNATVPGIDEATFQSCVKDAEVNCPISKLLKAEISVTATLN